MRKISFEEAYKSIRNRLRRFTRISIIRRVIEQMNSPVDDNLQDLLRAPWQALLIVKWACQDRLGDLQADREAASQEIWDIRQMLWSLPERLSLHDPSVQSGQLFVRRILRPQFELQRPETEGFIREAAILSSLNSEHPLRRIFTEKTGLDPDDFIDLSLAVYGAVTSGNTTITQKYFEPLKRNYPEEIINNYFQCTSRNLEELVIFCQGLPDSRRKVMSEYYEFPVLTRYPLFKDGDALHYWHKKVLFRGIEGFVHSVLSEVGEDYIRAFSKLFEDYVVDLTRRTDQLVLTEQEMRDFSPSEARIPDAVIACEGEANIFVEAKSGLFDESVMTVGSDDKFRHKTRSLLTATDQGWSASHWIRESEEAPAILRDAPEDFLLVVTNKELSAGRGTKLAEIYPEGTLTPKPKHSLHRLSLDSIYVLSIEDFERLMIGAERGDICLVEFLQQCRLDDNKPKSSKFFMEQHLSKHGVPRHVSNLVSDSLSESYARLEVCLGN